MNDVLHVYKGVDYSLPKNRWVWHLYGAGVESFGKDGKPEQVSIPAHGADELLVRIDAIGICFSDIKVINQGNKHPRVVGRDLTVDPVTLGHEAAVTVVGVGENLKNKFKIGERFIVQADVFFGGKSMAFGYAIPGAQAQYQIIPHEMIEGDEGCYLLPMKDETGYAEAALAEPWACVVASYRIDRRHGMKEGGSLLVIGDGDLGMQTPSAKVTKVASLDDLAEEGLFDDIVIFGSDADTIERASELLAHGGVMNILAAEQMSRPVKIDVGKIHYQNHAYLGTTSGKVSDGYAPVRMPSELKRGGSAWFIGGGGPMGQMHVQRAIEMPNGPKKVLATDIDTARLQSVKDRFVTIAKERGIEIEVVNPVEMSKEAFAALLMEFTGGAGFDDIVVLAPVAVLIEQAIPYLGKEGLMNIFAGVPIGTIAQMDLTPAYTRQVRFVGSSGSKITDLKDTLDAAESGALSTNTSVAAIGGMEASWDGMVAVKEGKFPGRVVIYPHIHGLPLTAVSELDKVLPEVYAKLTNGLFWNREAEEELLKSKWRPE
ncbi:MAG: alcohol dehydrogenase catalytic domain-containing protein [Armatimonadota bacterium]